MPSWRVHLVTANKVANRISVDKNTFLFANILPDINNAFFIEGVKNKASHKQTHFTKEEDLKEIKFNYNNVKRFKEEYKEKLKDASVLGYLVHLITDSYWNQMAFDEHYVYNEEKEFLGIKLHDGKFVECSKKEGTKVKQDEFKAFGTYLLDKNNIDYPIYTKDLVIGAKKIKENITDEEDVKKAIDYINTKVKEIKEPKEFDYKMFTLEELEKRFEDSIKFILNNIKEAL